MHPLHQLLRLLSAGASHLPGAGLAEGLMGANQMFNGQPPQMPFNQGINQPIGQANPGFLQGSLPMYEDLSGPANPQNPNVGIQQSAPRFFPHPQAQGGNIRVQGPNQTSAQGINLPLPGLGVQNRPNNQQIRL